MGNQFLSNIRECDAIIEVVRCFEDPEITHVDGTVDAARDLDVIDMELVLADLAMLEKATGKSKAKNRSPEEAAALQRALEGLSDGRWASSLGLDKADLEALRPYPLLTLKVHSLPRIAFSLPTLTVTHVLVSAPRTNDLPLIPPNPPYIIICASRRVPQLVAI